MLLAIVLALCLHCVLNLGILLVQKVGEAGDVLLFDHFLNIIHILIPVCRFDIPGTHTKSLTMVTLGLLHVQITGSWADVTPHSKICCLFVQCTLEGENGDAHYCYPVVASF